MKKNRISVLLVMAMMASSVFFQSCSKESNAELVDESQVELIKTSEITESGRKESIKDIASSILGVLDKMSFDTEMVDENYQSFSETYDPKSKKEYTIDEITEILEVNFGTKAEDSKELFSIAYENRELLVREGSEAALVEELIRQIEEMEGKGQRGIFSFLHSMLSDGDTHCSLEVLAHIADAMVGTAVAAITAPTGIGAVVAGANVVASVGQATVAASNCN